VNTTQPFKDRPIEQDLANKSVTVAGLPYYYQVHLNKLCNQKCIMCMPNGRHPHDEMPFDRFVAFFEQIKPHAEHLTLIGGEPLMYRWIAQVLDLLSQTKIAVTTITNATALTEKIAVQLAALNELNLRCSIDAASRRTYLKIHGTDHFSRVAAQIMQFRHLTRDNPSIRLIMHFVVMRENLNEVLDFIEFAKPYRPHRVEFHPVRHVSHWNVQNDTGWQFHGSEQSCEAFKPEYNTVMARAKIKCEAEAVPYEIILL
jgi:molybdenum cofactor biosynthesis enzyme MoaA